MSNADATRFDVIPYGDLSPEQSWIRIGKGSFGSVFKGEYLSLEVAIKEVLPSTEYDMQKYLAREIQIMQESRHPNVVQYLGLCLAPPAPALPDFHFEAKKAADQPTGQRILIISEFLTRGNVRSYISSRSLPFPWRLRMSFAIDVARAVAYMHARQCMHRDLKGENLLITDNHRIKVCDFGFARIAAKNEEEMRRMSYCGTDGYMSPEILMGLDFGLETDIFSLGIIFCEILTRRLVDGDFLKREMPSFGINALELREAASEGCPQALISLALHCCEPDGAQRPTIRTILDQLRIIEKDVIAIDNRTIKDPAEKAYNIGSMNFGGGMKTKKQLARPSGPGRIPSFQGKVSVPASEVSSSGSNSSDEAVEDVLKALEDVKIAGGHDVPQPGDAPRYSTSVISRSSRITNGSTTSSVATVRARPNATGHVQLPSSASSGIPSIPSSWLASVPTELQKVFRPDIESTPVAPTRDMPAPPVEDQDRASSSDESSAPQTPDVGPDSTLIQDDSKASFMTARTTTPSIACATVNAGDEDYEMVSSLDNDNDHYFEAFSEHDPALHRFTLVKPGWKLFWTNTPATAAKELKAVRRISTNEGLSLNTSAAPVDRRKSTDVSQLSSTGKKGKSEGKCDFCDKSFGWMKPYMTCDDCQYKVHPKTCADLAPRNCGCAAEIPPPAPVSPKENSSFAAKLKKRSRMLSQQNLVTNM